MRVMRLCIHINDEMQHQQEKITARHPQSYHSSKPSKLSQSSKAAGEGWNILPNSMWHWRIAVPMK